MRCVSGDRLHQETRAEGLRFAAMYPTMSAQVATSSPAAMLAGAGTAIDSPRIV
jgi:hypothetical protein